MKAIISLGLEDKKIIDQKAHTFGLSFSTFLRIAALTYKAGHVPKSPSSEPLVPQERT